MIQLLLALTGAFAVLLLTASLLGLTLRKKVELQQKIKDLTRGPELHREQDKKAERSKALFRKTAKIFAGRAYTKNIEIRLAQANLLLRGEEYILLVVLATILPALALLLLTRNIPLAAIAAFTGLLLPSFFVNRAREKRIKNFNGQLAESLVVMANSLRAGFSFFQALEMIAKELPPPISDEFARALREINLGVSIEDALGNLLKRMPSDDLDLVVTAVLTQRQVGGNLAEILDTISGTIRERVRIKGEIRTLTAQGRISGYVIGLMPVVLALLLAVMNPEYMVLLVTTKLGLIFLSVGFVSEVIGFLLIRKVVDIKF